jgi:hypothetical protein
MPQAQATFRHAELLDGGLKDSAVYTADNNKPAAGGSYEIRHLL